MANLSGFKFFDVNSKNAVSLPFANPNIGDALTLQVENISGSADINLKIEGMNDLERLDTWYELGILSLKDYKKLSRITEEGLYVIPLSGIYKVRVVSEGAVGGFKVFGISTGEA